MKALILAAGYATRLYPLTKDQPKALLPVAGRPILSRIIDKIKVLPDLSEIIVISNHRFINHFHHWRPSIEAQVHVPITIVDDFTTSDSDKRGAIGDIQFVLDRFEIDGSLLVIAGDNLFTYSLMTPWRVFREFEEDMILAQEIECIEDLKRFAVVQMNQDMHVIGMEEKPQTPKSNLAAFATYFYRRDTLPLIRQYLDEGGNPDAPGNFPVWLYQRRPLRVFTFDGICFDIGTHEAYEEAQTFFAKLDKEENTR